MIHIWVKGSHLLLQSNFVFWLISRDTLNTSLLLIGYYLIVIYS